MTDPRVSVIVATWRRPEELSRAIASIFEQEFEDFEVVVIADGNDPVGRHVASKFLGVRFFQLGRNWHGSGTRHSFGSVPRAVGGYLGRGDLISYLDDDDTWNPDHLSKCVAKLDEGNDLVWTKQEVRKNGEVIGHCGLYPLQRGAVGTSSMVHRAKMLYTATWDSSAPGDDYRLCLKWMEAGWKLAFIDDVTVVRNQKYS